MNHRNKVTLDTSTKIAFGLIIAAAAMYLLADAFVTPMPPLFIECNVNTYC